MIDFKISGATPKSGKTICMSCKNATIVGYSSLIFFCPGLAGVQFINEGVHHTIPNCRAAQTRRMSGCPTSRFSGTLLHRMSRPRTFRQSSGIQRYAVAEFVEPSLHARHVPDCENWNTWFTGEAPAVSPGPCPSVRTAEHARRPARNRGEMIWCMAGSGGAARCHCIPRSLRGVKGRTPPASISPPKNSISKPKKFTSPPKKLF